MNEPEPTTSEPPVNQIDREVLGPASEQGSWHYPPSPTGDGKSNGTLPPAATASPSGTRWLVALVVVVVLLAGMGIGVAVGHLAWVPSSKTAAVPTTTPHPSFAVPTTSTPTPGSGSSASGAPTNAAALAQATDPGLVDIDTVISSEAAQGAGTGIVLSSSGEVLTNNHVIEGETSISVTDVGNGKTYGATVVGYDPSQDLAVVQLADASGLKTVKIGNSSSVVTGNGVVAVGNAEGAGGTPSYAAGSVTATNQSITAQDELTGGSEQLSGLIEFNATIQPGDSGGAVVDSSGRVIGMTTAGSTGFEFQNSTQAYAIPITQAIAVAAQIEAKESSASVHIGPTAFLGVEVRTPFGGASGAEIVAVVPGDPAAQGGLVAGDMITALAGQPVTSPESLTTALLGEAPGDSVQVQYDNLLGQQEQVTVQLGSGPPA
jgi:S1-C subfamily serine protease